jgi:hypothetical protein
MLRLRDARTGELADVLPAGRRQLRILIYAPDPGGAGQVRAYLTADLLRRAAEVSQLLPLVSDFLPADADVAGLRAACGALNIHPPGDTFLGPASALSGVPPFDVGIAGTAPGVIAGAARLWARVPGEAGAADATAQALELREVARLKLMRRPYHDPAGDCGDPGDEAGTLARWRALVAHWARSPSGAMSRPHADAITGAFADDLDTPAALRALSDLADDAAVPDGVKFETFAAADRLLGLDLACDLGK